MSNSRVKNCDLITRKDGPSLFVQSESDNDAFYIQLDNYLLVPKEFVTAEELAAIWKRAGMAVQH